MGTVSDFNHTPLPDVRSIRVFTVEIRDGKMSIHVSVANIDRDPTTQYIALSYTWGSPVEHPDWISEYGPDAAVTVTLDDGIAIGKRSIARNLYEGLVQLKQLENTLTERLTTSATDCCRPLLLWADAISIDQDSNIERASQVAMMGDIYSKSTAVVAWLGEDDGTLEAVRLFHTTPGDALTTSRIVLDQYTTWEEAHDMAFVYQFEEVQQTIRNDQLIGLWKFYGRRYWKRAWIVQELALPATALILYGDFLVDWERVEQTAHWATVCLSRLYEKYLFMRVMPRMSQGRLLDVIDGVRTRQQTDGPRSTDSRQELLDLLSHCYGASTSEMRCFAYFELLLIALTMFECSDPRDHIYALVGLLNPFRDAGTTHTIEPRYDKTIEQVSYDITVNQLSMLPFATILSLGRGPVIGNCASLPSWVPDYNTAEGHSMPLFLVDRLLGRPSLRESESYGVYPTTERISTYQLEVRGAQLRLFGRFCGTVRKCCSPFPATDEDSPLELARPAIASFLTSMLSAYCDLVDEGHDGNSLGQALVESLVGMREKTEDKQLCVESFNHWVATTCAYTVLMAKWKPDLLVQATSCEQSLRRLAGFEPMPAWAEVMEWVAFLEATIDMERTGTGPGIWRKDANLDSILAPPAGRSPRDINRLDAIFEGSCRLRLGGRKLVTISGPRFGLAVECVQPGDEVWILYPAKVPFALRPIAPSKEFIESSLTRYFLLGEVYLQGAMKGEMVLNGTAGPVQKMVIE